MPSTVTFEDLPIEIKIYIFRNFFNFSEKVNVLKNNYFLRYLRDLYAWKEKPKVPFNTLKGAATHYLNDIEIGCYLNSRKKMIYSVQKNIKRGILFINEYAHKTVPTQKMCCKQHKVKKVHVPIDKIEKLLHVLKSDNTVLQNDIYTDQMGFFCFCIDNGILKTFELNTLIPVPNTKFCIFRKYYYFVIIYCNNGNSDINSSSNPELLNLLSMILHSNCSKIISSPNYFACRMFAWYDKFTLIRQNKFEFLSRKKLIKLTTTKRLLLS